MLAAAGQLAATVANVTWEDLVQHRVFDALNMTRSAPGLAALAERGDRAELASCYMQSGGARDMDQSSPVDCLDADTAGPCGSVISSAADFVKWQQLHMRQAIRACAPSDSNAPFYTGPRDQIQCPPGTVVPPPLAAAADDDDGTYLLDDDAWREYVHPNTIFPDWSSFGTYSLGMWWEPLYAEPNGWCLHHAGDLPGMASKQAMLPWQGHSVVALTNSNENPARFAVVLQLLDFMSGHAPPVPSWTDIYLRAMEDQHNEGVAADVARRAEIATIVARPGGAACPALEALVGWYAHPGYGNCSISINNASGALQVGHCATIWQHNNAAPWEPAFGTLRHLYFSTFEVVGSHLDVGAGTPTLTFHSTAGDGIFDRFESPLEQAVNPIVFVKAGSAYRGQGIGYSSGAVSQSFSGAVSQYNSPLPQRRVYA